MAKTFWNVFQYGQRPFSHTFKLKCGKSARPHVWLYVVFDRKHVKHDNLGYTSVDLNKFGHKDDPFILASQARQVFYVQDQLDRKKHVVLMTPPKNYRHSYDEVNEDFSTVTFPHEGNTLPPVQPNQLLRNESPDDDWRPGNKTTTIRNGD